MAWTLKGSLDYTIEDGVTDSVTTPGSPAEGDLVIYAMSSDNLCNDTGGGPTVQTAGFTDRSWDNTNANPGNEVGFKFMTATPDTTISFDNAGTEFCCGVMQTWSGGDSEDVTATSANGSGTNADPPAITTVTDGCLIFTVAHVDDDNTASTTAAPSGYGDLSAHDNSGNADNATVAMASMEQATLGLENPGTFTTSDDAWATVTLAFRPAADVGGDGTDIGWPPTSIPVIPPVGVVGY